jgi:F-type H+-transporting ATPase subunit a
MVAGHMVLLAIMGLAVAAAATTIFPYIAVASVVGSAILSCLELFVAFLQAYVFTFLSALFIGAAVHHH